MECNLSKNPIFIEVIYSIHTKNIRKYIEKANILNMYVVQKLSICTKKFFINLSKKKKKETFSSTNLHISKSCQNIIVLI